MRETLLEGDREAVVDSECVLVNDVELLRLLESEREIEDCALSDVEDSCDSELLVVRDAEVDWVTESLIDTAAVWLKELVKEGVSEADTTRVGLFVSELVSDSDCVTVREREVLPVLLLVTLRVDVVVSDADCELDKDEEREKEGSFVNDAVVDRVFDALKERDDVVVVEADSDSVVSELSDAESVDVDEAAMVSDKVALVLSEVDRLALAASDKL